MQTLNDPAKVYWGELFIADWIISFFRVYILGRIGNQMNSNNNIEYTEQEKQAEKHTWPK